MANSWPLEQTSAGLSQLTKSETSEIKIQCFHFNYLSILTAGVIVKPDPDNFELAIPPVVRGKKDQQDPADVIIIVAIDRFFNLSTRMRCRGCLYTRRVR